MNQKIARGRPRAWDRPMKLVSFLFVLIPLTCSAQVLTYGVQGGVPGQTARGQTERLPFVLGRGWTCASPPICRSSLVCSIAASAAASRTMYFSTLRMQSRWATKTARQRRRDSDLSQVPRVLRRTRVASVRRRRSHDSPHLDLQHRQQQRPQQCSALGRSVDYRSQDDAVECGPHVRHRRRPARRPLPHGARSSLLVLGRRKDVGNPQESGQFPVRLPALSGGTECARATPFLRAARCIRYPISQ